MSVTFAGAPVTCSSASQKAHTERRHTFVGFVWDVHLIVSSPLLCLFIEPSPGSTRTLLALGTEERIASVGRTKVAALPTALIETQSGQRQAFLGARTSCLGVEQRGPREARSGPCQLCELLLSLQEKAEAVLAVPGCPFGTVFTRLR